jgi:hypothetical protein
MTVVPTTFARLVSLLILGTFAVVLVACGQTVEIGDLEPRITVVGPVDYVDGEVRLSYAINDPAGNDRDITVEICQVASQVCGSAARPGPSSDSTAALPTLPAGTDVTHVFAWFLGCGKLVNGQQTPFALEASYLVRITLDDGGHEVESAPFSPGDDFQLSQLPPCP